MNPILYRNRLIGTLAGLCLSVTLSLAQPAPKTTDIRAPRLMQELERISKLAKGKVGICAVHLESGQRIGINRNDRFAMASTAKVAIAAQLFHLMEQGKLSMMTMVDVQPSDLHPGSGTLEVLFAKPGVKLSVQNLLELMMVISDNSATDMLIRLAGGTAAVTERLKTLGIQDMTVDRTIIQLIADLDGVTLPPDDQWKVGFYNALDQKITPEARRASQTKFRDDPRDTSTPDAMTELLTQIYRGTAIKPASRDTLLAVMERCRGGASRMKGFLPAGTVVAHKTGSLDGNATDDVGIITLPDGAGHIALTVFVGPSPQPLAEREQTIAQVSRAIYDYFLFQSPTATSQPR
jgi:beta-lactamase class A